MFIASPPMMAPALQRSAMLEMVRSECVDIKRIRTQNHMALLRSANPPQD
jgi:hypothetical protein